MQETAQLRKDILPRLGNQLIPILALVVGHIDHRKPIHRTNRRIVWLTYRRAIDIHSRILINRPLSKNMLKLLLVILRKKDVVHAHFLKYLINSPIKDQR